MIFSTPKKIRFHHCDPAGIVFYPQFFYLLHEAQEDFFDGKPQRLPDALREALLLHLQNNG